MSTATNLVDVWYNIYIINHKTIYVFFLCLVIWLCMLYSQWMPQCKHEIEFYHMQ
jgi:glycopeptide antibiotics resistance protein